MERQLVTFSLLSVQWQKYNKSYLDNFIPLFATLLIEKNKKNFEQKDYPQLATAFKELFYLPLPAYLVSSIVAKMLQLQLITKGNGVFVVNSQAIIEHKLYIRDEIDSCANKQNKVFSDFIRYCNEKYQRVITPEDANRIILSFIKENDADILFREIDISIDNKITPDELLLVGKYIYYLYENNPNLYRDIVNFAVGSIAFNAMYLAPAESNSESLKKCVFFLDSSFIFPLIGIDSIQRKTIVEEIIKEIRLKGGYVKIYQHTYDEVVEILETAVKYVESPLYDPIQASKALSYLHQNGYSSTDVETIITSIVRVLKENNIYIEKEIPNKLLGINEKDLNNEITENLLLKQNDYPDRYAERTVRDVNSIIYTYEKRKKINSKNFIDAKYSFITENALLTKADKKVVHKYSTKHTNPVEFFPAAIPEAMLCAYLYLGSSNKAVENITLSVLATAFASIRPTAELENLVKVKAKQLKDKNIITETDYNLVLATHLIKDCLTEKSLTSYGNVTEDTIFDLIEAAKKNITIEERNKRKETEEKLLKEKYKNNKRKEKADKIIKNISIFICGIKYILLLMPYLFSFYLFLNNDSWISVMLFIVWTSFTILINHFTSFKVRNIWKITHQKVLTKVYNFFELDENIE